MGTVMLIGGALRADNAAVLGRAAAVLGPRVGVFATASGDPGASWAHSAGQLRAHGVTPVDAGVTAANARESAHDPAVLGRLEGCSGFFFGGGDQRRLARALLGTPASQLLRRKFAAGAGLAGTSAGTAVMADPMISGGSSLGAWLGGGQALEMEPGFGFVRGVQVDQHFLAWGRFGRLLQAMERAGARLGVGVDEDTALVMPEAGPWEVLGAGHVAFLERQGGQTLLSLLAQGDRYDPGARHFHIHPDRPPIRAPEPELTGLASADIFGPGALPWLLTRLAESPDDAAIGLAFRAEPAAEFSAEGVRFRFSKTAQTAGHYGDAGGARHSVVRVGLEAEGVRVSVSGVPSRQDDPVRGSPD